jgi:hypothetical protein
MTPEEVASLDFGCPHCGELHRPVTGHVLEGAGTRFCPTTGLLIPAPLWEAGQAKEAVLFVADTILNDVTNGTGIPNEDAWTALEAAWQRWVCRVPPVFLARDRDRWAQALRRVRRSP